MSTTPAEYTAASAEARRTVRYWLRLPESRAPRARDIAKYLGCEARWGAIEAEITVRILLRPETQP